MSPISCGTAVSVLENVGSFVGLSIITSVSCHMHIGVPAFLYRRSHFRLLSLFPMACCACVTHTFEAQATSHGSRALSAATYIFRCIDNRWAGKILCQSNGQ